ncbi:hypothetical protein BCR44DRAFT_34464 [Catenaria anguillulae PL171]|uniref:Uncharacterized protein n=1 Tax=Catenaria anguillulae PL171 TaxID=765915 RepID=A0A1Y2I517_9FUNG|nr:hypothetical protein BCR44DRAFT_34464 [Catenaria anguillulae PL171]
MSANYYHARTSPHSTFAPTTGQDIDHDEDVDLRASIRKECDDLLRDLDWVLGHDQSPHPPRGSAEALLGPLPHATSKPDDNDNDNAQEEDLLLSQLDKVLGTGNDGNQRTSPPHVSYRGRENRIPAPPAFHHQPSKPAPSRSPLTHPSRPSSPRLDDASPRSRHLPLHPVSSRRTPSSSTAAPVGPLYFMPAVPSVPKIREPSVLYGPRHADSPTMVIERQSDELVKRYFSTSSTTSRTSTTGRGVGAVGRGEHNRPQ